MGGSLSFILISTHCNFLTSLEGLEAIEIHLFWGFEGVCVYFVFLCCQLNRNYVFSVYILPSWSFDTVGGFTGEIHLLYYFELFMVLYNYTCRYFCASVHIFISVGEIDNNGRFSGLGSVWYLNRKKEEIWE